MLSELDKTKMKDCASAFMAERQWESAHLVQRLDNGWCTTPKRLNDSEMCGFPGSQSGKPLKVSVHHNTQAVRSLVKSGPHTDGKINPHVHESQW